MKKLYVLFLSVYLLTDIQSFSQISLSGPAYTQNFNSLSNTGTTNNLTITGWLMTETGGGARDNEQYAFDNGGSNTGDTYSYGATGDGERALGSLRSGTLIPVYGAFFTNNTGATLTSLTISYTGEQWRLGTAARTDRLDFQYSLNATSLTTGSWVDVDALDFITPNTATIGSKDGNIAANQTALSSTIVSLSIPNGATFYIRWNDFDASGADDGLAIDGFTVAATGGSGPLTITTSTPLPNGTVSVPYNQTISASGGTLPYTFSISAGSLPTGTTIDAAGNITGTPTASGTFNFTVDVTDGTPTTVSKAFTITIINAPCSPPTHTIAEIQGSGNSSPFVGNVETTSGIVTGVRSNGFFMQTPDASADADLNTSEGIFVFTAAAPPAGAAVGNTVCVTGTVAEFIPSTDPNSPSQTELVAPSSITVLSTGNPLPAAITLTIANTNPAGGLFQLERFESMRVHVSSLTVVAPTQGNKTESSATSVSNGFFYGVITGVARPFREPGIAQPDPLPPGAPVTVTRWDANPELIGVGSNSIGGPAIDVATGAILTNVVGPLDYRSRVYTIDIDPAIPPIISNNGLTFTAVPLQTTDELTVATFNMERFYDNINDPDGDAVLTLTAYNNRLNKVSLAIRNVLRTPDIIGVVEVEKLVVLQAIATKVNNDAVINGDPNPNYVAYLVEGNDVGGIDVGFLVKSERVNVISVIQYGLTTTYTDPSTGLQALLNDRPPLVLTATFTKPGCTTTNPFTVIVNHLRSLNGVDDIGANGVRVRAKRKAQAEYLANLIQGFQTSDPTANIISVGDYNAFEFSDGYVDGMGTIKGAPTPAANVVLASPDLVNPNLTNLVETYTAAQRYSYSFNGSAQVLDHILVNSNLASKISRFSIAKLDVDFPEIYRNDPNRPERISDHDAPVAYILFTDDIPPVITCPSNITVNAAAGFCSAVVTYTTPTATDNCSGTITVTRTAGLASGSVFPGGTSTVTHRATDAAGNITDCSFTVTVIDNQPPLITCPANITVSNTANLCSAVVTFNLPAVTDNCQKLQAPATILPHGGGAITVAGNNLPGGYYFNITNNSAFTQTIGSVSIRFGTSAFGVVPSPAPVSVYITTSATTYVGNQTNAAAWTVIGSNIPVTVAGPGSEFSLVPLGNGITLAPGVTRGMYVIGTASSLLYNNAANSNFTPITNGVLTLTPGQASGGVFTAPGLAPRVPNIILNYSRITQTAGLPSGSVFPVGVTTNTFRATDDAGNTADCSFTVTVNDTQAPTITCPANVTRATDAGVCTATFAPNNPTAADNCGVTVQTWALTGATTGTSPATGINTVGSRAFNIGVTTVTYTVKDAAGNTTTCTFTITITDALLPVITTQPVNRTVCTGTTATFSVISTNAVSYQWQQFIAGGWTNVTGATGASFSVTNPVQSMNTNTFRVNVTGLCTTVPSAAATLFVNPLPTISLTSSNPALLLPGQTTSIVANVNPTGGTFAWFKNGVARLPTVTTGTLSNLGVDDAGTYYAVYTDLNGCVATSANIVISAEASDLFFVAPNPNFGQFWVRYYNQLNEPLTVIVYDSKGARVHQQTSATTLPYTQINVDMRVKSSGIYLVELRGADGRRLGAKQIAVGTR